MKTSVDFLMTTLHIEKIPGGKIEDPFDGKVKEDISSQRLMVTIEYVGPVDMNNVSDNALLIAFSEHNNLVRVEK